MILVRISRLIESRIGDIAVLVSLVLVLAGTLIMSKYVAIIGYTMTA